MSGYATHMLIGAVGGLALTRSVNFHSPDFSPATTQLMIVGASALLATWPDIDEPRSFISRRVRAVVMIFFMGWMAVTAYRYAANIPIDAHPVALGFGGLIVGAILGSIAGKALVMLIRRAAGGHRRLTHSAVVGAGLMLAAYATARSGLGVISLALAALAWGQFLHILGDIVTPSGVPILYPFDKHDLRIMPKWLGGFGEAIAAIIAVGLGYLLITG
jgi:membrane-bound metal-dependent hydrolase YbcI (DUF457 family)